MYDNVNVGKRVMDYSSSPQFEAYTAVRVYFNDDEYYEATSDMRSTSGRTLEVFSPFATQEMADKILADLNESRFRYKPFEAGGTHLDPAAELGDSITVNGEYSAIYEMETDYDTLCLANVSSPYDEEIDHEYAFEGNSEEKRIRREMDRMSSELSVKVDAISATVEGEESKCSWKITKDNFVVASKGVDVLKVDSNGLTVKGKIEATSGTIGGFTIENGYIYSGKHNSMGSEENGVYLGAEGLSIGSKFRVWPSGNITCGSLTVKKENDSWKTSYGGALSGCGGSISAGIGVVSGSTTTELGTYIDNLIAKKITASYIQAKSTAFNSVTVYGKLTISGTNSIVYKGNTLIMKSLEQIEPWRYVVCAS